MELSGWSRCSYGVVHRAMWRGTEVAVKLISIHASAEAARNFKKEVGVILPHRFDSVVMRKGLCFRFI